MRICLVYDCLYPHTVGGAERWYRALAEALDDAGHEVTYLTRKQWPRGERPDAPRGTRVIAVSPGGPLYTADGRRSIGQPLRFGVGVLRHLARHGDRYDAVHTASFPYFSLLAAAAARARPRRDGYHLVVDWHELWTREYWREYLGAAGGVAGWLVQRACVAVPQRAFCFSRLHERRLREEGLRGQLTVLEGEYAGSRRPPTQPRAVEPLVVFAGRHIPEKRVPALVPALALAHERVPGLRAEILGTGPDLERVRELVAEHGSGDIVALRGFVSPEEVEDALDRAMCMVLPSRREGYGLIVVEASAAGTPSVVVLGEDNAATELVEDGVNGVVAPTATAEDLAEAIVRVHAGGAGMRASTADWYRRNAERLSLRHSLEAVVGAYR
ncbi:MAG: glycosyltransferase family 4 protein [Solirubrobacteraceae bacterium]